MEKKIVGLNTYFKSLEYENFDEYEFSARISLLDYDAVVIIPLLMIVLIRINLVFQIIILHKY